MRRVPNPHSHEEVRRAFQHVQYDTAVLTAGAVGEVLVGAGAGVQPVWTTSLTTLTLLTVDNITINAAMITSSTGAISFDNENLSTSGTISGVNVTSGADPGHTHTSASVSLAHDALSGLTDDDHSQYHNDTRGDTRYYQKTEFINESDGAADAGKPIITNADGLVDDTFLDVETLSYEAVTDNALIVGRPVYTQASGKLGLACADVAGAYGVIGVAADDSEAAATATYVVSGTVVERANWTLVTGDAALTPGVEYYLAEEDTAESPDYGNTGGTGNRSAIITATSDMGHTGTGGAETEVDGTKPAVPWSTYWIFTAQAVAGKYIRFDFGEGASKRITEAKWYQSSGHQSGVWQWQGSNDAVTWFDIGSTFTLGAGDVVPTGYCQTQTALAGNSSGYRYYQLLGVSGNSSSSPYQQECEFKICDYGGVTTGKLTSTAPTTAGSYLVRVGRAISATELLVDVSRPILL